MVNAPLGLLLSECQPPNVKKRYCGGMAATVGTAITMVFIVKVMMYIYSYVVGKWLMFNVLILVV